MSEQTNYFRWTQTVFFLSGMASLLYQIVWQRALFTIYGTNSESVTIIVSAFMLGLGLGSLLGGWFSKQSWCRHLLFFGIAEIGIGVFGFVSLPLFTIVGRWTLLASYLHLTLLALALLLIPTLLMGGTLPILVEDRVLRTGRVGESVSSLYFINTLGAALGAFAAGSFLLRELGLRQTTGTAAAVNLVIGSAAVALHFRERRKR